MIVKSSQQIKSSPLQRATPEAKSISQLRSFTNINVTLNELQIPAKVTHRQSIQLDDFVPNFIESYAVTQERKVWLKQCSTFNFISSLKQSLIFLHYQYKTNTTGCNIKFNSLP